MQYDMDALRKGLYKLYDTMEGAQKTADVKIALVPYNHTVKVSDAVSTAKVRSSSQAGAGLYAAWLDTEGLSSIHGRLFADESTNRFELLDEVGADWGGCVVARPYPHDVNATPVSSADYDTFFVPWFAPDEEGDAVRSNGSSDRASDGVYYHNTYIADESAACDDDGDDDDDGKDKDKKDKKDKKPKKAKKGKKGKTPVAETAQTRVCKYEGQKPAKSRDSMMGRGHYGIGPNMDCPTGNTIVPLTAKFGDLRSATRDLTSGGNTDLVNGFIWSWHNLTPYAPFPKASKDAKTRKNIILMTDGVNTYSGAGYFGYAGYVGANKSGYSSYEYLGAADQDLIGNVSKNGYDQVRDALNDRFSRPAPTPRRQGSPSGRSGFASTR